MVKTITSGQDSRSSSSHYNNNNNNKPLFKSSWQSQLVTHHYTKLALARRPSIQPNI